MILNFNFYSSVYERELSVEAGIEYKEPEYNNDVSDLDNKGFYDILSLEVFNEDGTEFSSNDHEKVKLLDFEIRDKMNQYLRCMEIEDCYNDYDCTDLDKVYYGDIWEDQYEL